MVITGWLVLTGGMVSAGQESSLYSVEWPFAQSQHTYMVIDPKARAIWIKARGIPVRTFEINAITWVGNPIAQPSVCTVEEKRPLMEPPMTVPLSLEQRDRRGAQGLQKPLMVSDMPTYFEVELQCGLSLMIQSIRTTSLLQKNWDVLKGWMSLSYSRMATWGLGLWSEAPSCLVLVLTPAEAQGLYWALVPSTRVILHPGT